jgi:hypothetical protein
MNTQSVNHDEFRSNVTNSRSWMRLVYMLIFAVLLHLAGLVMWVLCALQFLFALWTGRDNANLRSLGGSIAVFVHEALDFVSYNSEQKPFPFAAWPQNPHSADDNEVIIVEPQQVDDDHDEGAGGDSSGNNL